MVYRMLAIGINYTGSGNQLAGCINDARDWRAQFAPICVSHDELIEQSATKAGMVSAIATVLGKLAVGDTAIITYSGHGTYIPDRGGDEADGRDEALCPFDLTRNLLLDDELRDLLSQRVAGSRVLLITDCCHSGTMTRASIQDWKHATTIGQKSSDQFWLRWTSDDGLYYWLHPVTNHWVGEPDQITMPNFPTRHDAYMALLSAPRPVSSTPRYVPFADLTACMCSEVVDRITSQAKAARSRASLDDPGLVHWSGCKDSEVSYDATIGGRACGAFSNAALKVLANNRGKFLKHDTVAQLITAVLPNQRFPQSPQFNGDLSLYVPGYEPVAPAPVVQPGATGTLFTGRLDDGRKFKLEIGG